MARGQETLRNRRKLKLRQWTPFLVPIKSLDDFDESSCSILIEEYGLYGTVDSSAFTLKFNDVLQPTPSVVFGAENSYLTVLFQNDALPGDTVILTSKPYADGLRTKQGGYMAPVFIQFVTPA